MPWPRPYVTYPYSLYSAAFSRVSVLYQELESRLFNNDGDYVGRP